MEDNKSLSQVLLDEFREICEENEIEYELAWGPESIGCGVFMSISGCRKFMAAVEESGAEHRALESRENSPAYPNDTVRYVRTDTLCYNVLDYTNYINHGIFVEINIVRGPASGMADKFYRACERSMMRKSYSFKAKAPGKNSARDDRFFRWGCRFAGGEDALRVKCFRRMMQQQGPELGSVDTSKLKAVKYGKEYLDYCIVEEDIDGAAFFADAGQTIGQLEAEGLKEARDAKAKLDKKREQNDPNLKEAAAGWEAVQAADEKIRAEAKVEAETEPEPEETEGA